MTTEMRSRHLIEVATQKCSKGKESEVATQKCSKGKESEVATPISGNKKREVATRVLTVEK